MRFSFLLFAFILFSCSNSEKDTKSSPDQYLVVLGTAQDGGYPHIGCKNECCNAYYDGKASKKRE